MGYRITALGILFILGLSGCKPEQPDDSIVVKLLGEECVGQPQQMGCTDDLGELEQALTYIRWEGTTAQCHESYGAQNCNNGAPIPVAVAQASGHTVPVYQSAQFPGFFLANGYPVILGSNQAPAQLVKQVSSLYKAVYLSQLVCTDGECASVGSLASKPYITRYELNSLLQL